ncbi:hypothetical protein L1987_14792 [Smallanthus sonchifolius]|uniref:Uncharacterized protein n=1 Tax=Smallanthus sonchifolius TaxID=185202 RepID=A0ACB9J4U1_9ASTR|nr:hypothetical protein L1987_14792 [Smallanthus sonchifolius]
MGILSPRAVKPWGQYKRELTECMVLSVFVQLSLRGNTILNDGTNGNTDFDSNNEMARRGNGRRGGGRTGGRTGGRNGGRGRTPARQEYSEEGSVHTEPAVSVHGTEQTQIEEQPSLLNQK